MVLCKHFQQGYCRFGSKCTFEHLDIKQLVKSDVEGAINGKQYLFSCYGPFKDKPCIPNFIEDQSFEELRMMCYEAKQKNCFEQFNQLTRQCAADAMNKMKALIQPSYEIMNMLMMIYDAPANSASVGNTTNAASNPFGLNSNTTTNAGSIFGKSNLSQANNNGNVFGGTGIFGGATAANNTQTAGSIFGGQNAFGAPQQQQPVQTGSIFGQTASQQQSAVSNSIFGGGMNKTSLFGQQQPLQQGTAGGGFGLFAQASNTQNAPAFGQPPSFGQPQQMQPVQQQNVGIFGQNQNTFNNQQANVSPFGQNQTQPQTQNMFAQSASMMPTQQQQQPGMFAQAAAQAPQTNGFFQQSGATMSMENMQQQPAAVPQQQALQQTAPPPQNTSSIYSRMEDLTAEDIAAFKAEIFEPGKLPFVPPPLELING